MVKHFEHKDSHICDLHFVKIKYYFMSLNKQKINNCFTSNKIPKIAEKYSRIFKGRIEKSAIVKKIINMCNLY